MTDEEVEVVRSVIADAMVAYRQAVGEDGTTVGQRLAAGLDISAAAARAAITALDAYREKKVG